MADELELSDFAKRICKPSWGGLDSFNRYRLNPLRPESFLDHLGNRDLRTRGLCSWGRLGLPVEIRTRPLLATLFHIQLASVPKVVDAPRRLSETRADVQCIPIGCARDVPSARQRNGRDCFAGVWISLASLRLSSPNVVHQDRLLKRGPLPHGPSQR